MLDTAIREQLTQLFKDLDKKVELVVEPSQHEKAAELNEMLDAIAGCSDKISVVNGKDKSPQPKVSIWVDGNSSGVSFRGIPGGHEFSSLILGIANAAGIGKMPDEGLRSRIKRIKGPAKIRTYISLSCENCPDVVQALNQIAIIHPDLSHEMVDGGLAQEETDKLGIQGVPAVFIDDKMIHSGRSDLNELTRKLEENLGQTEAIGNNPQELNLGHFDVTVIGGGPAGVSSAIYSVRKGLKTAIVAKTIGGQVQQTGGIENMISVVFTEGPQLTANLLEHLKAYPVDIYEHRQVKHIKDLDDGTKQLSFDSGESMTCDTLIIATGAQWKQLGIPGEKEYTGRGVAYCPHCDGPYYKEKKVAVIGGGNSGVEAAIDLAGICSEVVLLEFQEELKADRVLIDKLKLLKNVSVVTEAKTSEVIGDGEKVVGLTYQDRATQSMHKLDLDGVFVQIGLSPNSAFVSDLLEINPYGEIVTDTKGRTSVPGIYAAGDVTTVPYKQIVISMGEGAKVALAAFEDRMRAQ